MIFGMNLLMINTLL